VQRGHNRGSDMEREQQIEVTGLKDEDLEAVNGGVFRFIRAIFYPGKSETDSGLATNSQAWVTSAT
jgi:hypothetical protein